MQKKELITQIDEIYKSISDNKNMKKIYSEFKNWINNFLSADLTDVEKFNILKYSQPAFPKFKDYCDDKPLGTFIKLVSNNRFTDAINLSKYLSYQLDEKRDYVKQLVKQRKIYLLSPKLDMEMGGLGHIVVHRANYLANQGYDVTIINAGPIKNYNHILKFYRDNGRLSENVKFINYLEYFSIRNSDNMQTKNLEKNLIKSSGQYSIEKKIDKDNSVHISYYTKENKKVKSEIYVDECLIYSEDEQFVLYYTQDGFNYLKIDKSSKKHYLNEKESNITLEFKNKLKFFYHFLVEICFVNKKPFIVCDSTTHWYNLNGISLKRAFKIGCLHGNPFIDFDPKKGLNPKINHFKRIETYDKVVLLTESVKDELKDFIDEKYLTVIPNFVKDEFIDPNPSEKDMNKIAVFTRIAPVKNLSDIIEAFNIIKNKNKTAYLDIYGGTFTPDEEEELIHLKELVKKYNLEERIHFKGYVNDVNSKMKDTLLTVLTSKQEGLSVSTIELMANSTPIISYDVRYGPSDLITDNIDGILIEEGDVNGLARNMLELLENTERTIEMGVKAKQKIKDKFSMSSVCPLWENLFIDIFIENEIKDQINKIEKNNKYNNLIKSNKKLSKENKHLKNENNELTQLNSEILSSNSWKITKPLRKLRK